MSLYCPMATMKYLIFFLLIFSKAAFSQQIKTGSIWHVTVSNTLSGKKIPGASISINGKRYYIANDDGQIDIDKGQIYLHDTLKISCIGFQSKVIIAEKNFIYSDNISLSPVNILLNEVSVNSSKQMIKIGDVKKIYNTHRGTSPNTMYIQYIPNDKGVSGIITTIEYFVNDQSRGIERPFKVGLYTKGRNDVFPDQKLLNDSVVVFNPEKKKKITVDVSKYNISLPKDGVMAVFETLSPESYGNDQYWESGQLYSKVPGIDMDLKQKGNYAADTSKYNRAIPYALVMGKNSNGQFSIEENRYQAYLYSGGNNFAIIITVE